MTQPKYEYWVCDNCHRTYPVRIPQFPVRVEQQIEHMYGTGTTYRPIEQLIICPVCRRDLEGQR